MGFLIVTHPPPDSASFQLHSRYVNRVQHIIALDIHMSYAGIQLEEEEKCQALEPISRRYVKEPVFVYILVLERLELIYSDGMLFLHGISEK